MKRFLKLIGNHLNFVIFDAYRTSFSALGVYRIGFCLVALTLTGIPSFSELASLEDFMYNPAPGLGSLFTGFPSPAVLQAVDILIVLSILAVTIGWKTPFWTVLLVLLIWLGNSWRFALGKIDHGGMMWIFALLLAFHWGRSLSLDASRERGARKLSTGWPVALAAIVLAFLYFSAGVPKLLGGWLDTDFSMFRNFANIQYYQLNHQALLAPEMMNMQSGFFWEAMDWLTIIFELGFLAAVLWPRIFRLFCLVALVFHVAVYLLMNIPFLGNGPMLLLFLITPVINDDRIRKLPTWVWVSAVVVSIMHVAGFDFRLLQLLKSAGIDMNTSLIVLVSFMLAGFVFWFLGYRRQRLPVAVTGVIPTKMKKRILAMFACALIYLFSQFAFVLAVTEPYPTLLMPSFGKTMKFRKGDVRISSYGLIVKCDPSENHHIGLSELMPTTRSYHRERCFRRVFLGQGVRGERPNMQKKIRAYAGSSVATTIAHLRNRPVSAAHRAQATDWVLQRARDLSGCAQVNEILAIQEVEMRDRQSGRILQIDTASMVRVYHKGE